jgi:hypothetical protein
LGEGGHSVVLRHSLTAVVFGAGLLLIASKPAHAQNFHTYAPPLSDRFNSPYASRGPSVSPYINLFGRNPVVSYFGIVRPSLEMRQIQTQQAQAIQTLGRQVPGAEPKTPDVWSLPKTGHTSYFMNFSHYYPKPR